MGRELVTLDQPRWKALWSRLGAQGSGHSIFVHLAASYAEPSRVYHTAEHILDCLAQFDLTRALARRPDEVEAGLWFHDVVYLPGASDNEEQSAQLAQTALAACSVSQPISRRVAALVLATRHLIVPPEPDAQLLCDIDLSIMGRDPETFDRFEARIRREYAWVPEPVYRSSRSEVLAGFLRRRSIYLTDHFRDRYEVPARQNLHRLIARLGSESSKA
jgi:predicted metal-dependent HD superfamily phosphohydrolase